MEMVISAGNQVAMDMPGGVAIGEGLKAQCSAVKERWERVYRATELWGKTLEKVNPEMEHFQVRHLERDHFVGIATSGSGVGGGSWWEASSPGASPALPRGANCPLDGCTAMKRLLGQTPYYSGALYSYI